MRKDVPVLVTGAFDVMHIGHIRLLEYARSFSPNRVIVMIDSDKRIASTKGHTRPFNCFSDREEFLLSLKCVDFVMPIETNDDIIVACKQHRPIRVIGGDWKGKRIIGEEHCWNVCYFDRIDGYSTTRILANGK